jgi:hypothetical protein
MLYTWSELLWLDHSFLSNFHCLTFILLHHLLYSECPEECREAVSSLMFAAARFSDMPELRDLRQIFHERYGNSLELFVNQEVKLNELTLNRVHNCYRLLVLIS